MLLEIKLFEIIIFFKFQCDERQLQFPRGEIIIIAMRLVYASYLRIRGVRKPS